MCSIRPASPLLPPLGCVSQSSQVAYDNSGLAKISAAKLALCHRSGLFLPHGADENENRGVEGEREVG